jgi:hypothetical protein
MELMGSATHLRRGYGAPSIEHVAIRNVKTHTMRAFRNEEMEKILAKIR